MHRFLLDKKLIKYIDFPLLVAVLIIALFGCANIYAASYNTAGGYYDIHNCRSQLIYIVLSLIIIYFSLLFDYNLIANWSFVIYLISVGLLLYTDVAAKHIKGAKSWIKVFGISLEPGEIIRIGLILLIAKMISSMKGDVNNPKNLAKILICTAIPIAFIIKQPNYGLAVICLCLVFAMLFISKLNLKIILGGILVLLLSFSIAWKFNILKPYQMERITSFINPDNSSSDATLQVDNSITAIGSGGTLGKGFLKSTQAKGGYIPEDNTDMIFAVVGEEWGLAGAAFLLILYIFVLIRLLINSKRSRDLMGKLICIGYFASLVFSIYWNIGMTIRMAPISGITLPFMSYGGCSIVTNFITLGLVLNVSMRRNKINF